MHASAALCTGGMFDVPGRKAKGAPQLTDLHWEDPLVVQDVLRPVHERVDVLGRGQLRRLLVPHPVFPQVFVSAQMGRRHRVGQLQLPQRREGSSIPEEDERTKMKTQGKGKDEDKDEPGPRRHDRALRAEQG